MATYWGSIGAGYTQALDAIQERKRTDQAMKAQQFLMDQETAGAQADAAGADALTSYLAQIAQPAPPPGQSSQPMQSPAGAGPIVPQMPKPPAPAPQSAPGQPGVMPGAPGSPAGPAPSGAAPATMQAFGGRPQPRPMGPQAAPQAPPQPLPPYRDPMQSPGQGLIPAFPQMPAAPPMPDPSKLPPPQQMAADLKKKGVKPAAILAALKGYMPLYENAQRDQIKEMEVQIRAQNAAQTAYLKEMAEAYKNDRANRAEDRRDRGQAQRYEVDKQKADAATLRAQKYMTSHPGSLIPSGDVDELAHAVADYRVDVRSLSTRGGFREKVQAAALRLNPDFDQKEFTAENAFNTSGERAAGTAAANTAIAARAAQGGADILEQSFQKLGTSTMPLINRLLSGGRAATGDANQAAVEAALNTFVNEYGRAVNPKGTATVSDKNHIREILSTADSQETFAARMNILRQEMARGVNAPREVHRQMGRDRQGNKAPPVGTIESGYRFKGGDPGDAKNWERVQ